MYWIFENLMISVQFWLYFAVLVSSHVDFPPFHILLHAPQCGSGKVFDDILLHEEENEPTAQVVMCLFPDVMLKFLKRRLVPDTAMRFQKMDIDIDRFRRKFGDIPVCFPHLVVTHTYV